MVSVPVPSNSIALLLCTKIPPALENEPPMVVVAVVIVTVPVAIV